MPIHNDKTYSEKIARLERSINAEKAVLNDLVESAMKNGRPISSPEILEQNSKVSSIIEDYNRLVKGK